MMQLAIVTTGTLCGSVCVLSAEEGLHIGGEMLARLGVRDGDELQLHTDGTMLVVVPAKGSARDQGLEE